MRKFIVTGFISRIVCAGFCSDTISRSAEVATVSQRMVLEAAKSTGWLIRSDHAFCPVCRRKVEGGMRG